MPRDKHVLVLRRPAPRHPPCQPACGFLAGALLSQAESWAEHSQALQRLSRSQVHGTNRWSVLSSSEELQMIGKIFLPISKERNN